MKKQLKSLVICAFALLIAFSFSLPQGLAWADDSQDALRVATSYLNGIFSPFFAESEPDTDIVSMSSLVLLTTDRQGAVIMEGNKGEKRTYDGKTHKYYGPADITITKNSDRTVDYDIDLRKDITFSDGEKLTADDLIFSMYVLADPTYDGPSIFNTLPIKGIKTYRKGMSTLASLIADAGEYNTDYTYWTKDQQNDFWDKSQAAAEAIAQEICDYCKEMGYNGENDPVEKCAESWGYKLKKGATIKDFASLLLESYDFDIDDMIKVESAGSSITDVFPNWYDYLIGIKTGKQTSSIKGIRKTGDYSVRVTMTEFDSTAIYQFDVPLAPLHYYGDESKYDYDNNKFGFTKGDLSSVREKSDKPMGAGPYKFVKYSKGKAYLEANDEYYLGSPKTEKICYIETADSSKLSKLVKGTVDIADVPYTVDTVRSICKENSNGKVSGDKIRTVSTDNLGYGYLGISADAVKVGNEPGSKASKYLRKAFATVIALFREASIENYYGETASVINYPISNTSWAAPQDDDDGYEVAFSRDIDGNKIYRSGMSAEDKESAALKAALDYFDAAGYTVNNGKITAAPKGAKLSYEVWVPGDGSGDHPSFEMLEKASEALEKIGIDLKIIDLYDSADLWAGLELHNVPMWCAAWGATPDPDMYQIYYSDIKNSSPSSASFSNPYGGAKQGGSNYMYCIADPELDSLILKARTSADHSYRKNQYKKCLDIIMDWAVEIPVYQRQNAIAFSTERVNMDTVTSDITTYYGWEREVQDLQLGETGSDSDDSPVSIKSAKITVENQEYTGKKIKPTFTVRVDGKKLKEDRDYTVSYKNNKNVGTATITVKGTGDYTGKAKKTFKILPKATSIKTITPLKKGFKVTYKKISKQATGYQVQYSRSRGFKSSNKTKLVKKYSTVSKKVTKLKSKKTYYVRVRTYKTVDGVKYFSEWSDAVKVKTK